MLWNYAEKKMMDNGSQLRFIGLDCAKMSRNGLRYFLPVGPVAELLKKREKKRRGCS